MLSFEFSDFLSRIAGRSEGARLFVATVSRLAGIVESFLEEANSNAKLPQHFNIQNSVISSVRSVTNDVDIWRLYDSAKEYLEELSEPGALGKTSALIEGQIRDVQNFLEHYKRYMHARDYSTSFDLMLLAHKIQPKMVGLSAAATVAGENLSADRDIDESEIELYSYNGAVLDLNEYVKILSALLSIYSAVSQLVDVNVHEEPLVVEKLETGSLFLKLKGAIKTIRVMTHVLKRAIKYGAMHHSLAGRIEQLPKAADAVAKIIDLRECLAKNGVDVSAIDSEIESATLKIAKQANLLVSRMSEIGLNGELLTSKEQLLIALEESASHKLLGYEEPDDRGED